MTTITEFDFKLAGAKWAEDYEDSDDAWDNFIANNRAAYAVYRTLEPDEQIDAKQAFGDGFVKGLANIEG